MQKNQSPITLYLTKEEQKMFGALPQNVRSAWSVETETLTFADSAEKRAIRMRNLSVKHPALKKLKETAGNAGEKEALAQAQSIDLSGLSQDDVMELAFAWGPQMFTDMIAAALPSVATAEDVDAVANFLIIRHGLLQAMNR